MCALGDAHRCHQVGSDGRGVFRQPESSGHRPVCVPVVGKAGPRGPPRCQTHSASSVLVTVASLRQLAALCPFQNVFFPPWLLSGSAPLLSEVPHDLPKALFLCRPSAPPAACLPWAVSPGPRLNTWSPPHTLRGTSVSPFSANGKPGGPSDTLLSLTPCPNRKWALPWVCVLIPFSTAQLPSPGCPRLLWDSASGPVPAAPLMGSASGLTSFSAPRAPGQLPCALTLPSFPFSLVSFPILALQPRCPKLGFLRRCCSSQLECS